ncbi:hypothetical protein BBP40_000570 [Aspergillus hancockii]|nr:hypothetical protein BBP40_000570 [Aspergillus hancockii]
MSTQYKTISPIHKDLNKKDCRKALIARLKSQVGKGNFETLKPRSDGAISNRIAEIADGQDGDNTPISSRRYHCVTDAPDPLGLQIGLNGGIPRWKAGSTVQFAAFEGGYPTVNDAYYAAQMLNKAAEDWNELELPVTFKWVEDINDAAFVLEYGGDAGGTLARAFFPDAKELNTVQVYKTAFDPLNVKGMKDVFVHELGHVLGLRHEHAPELEGDTITIGKRNRNSVMGYLQFPPKMQESDKDDVRKFYSIPPGNYKGWPVKDWEPDN